MTRCEAYLDSKGFLRWWAARRQPQANQPVRESLDEHRDHPPRAATATAHRRGGRAGAGRACPRPAAAHGADTSPWSTADIDIEGRTLWLPPHALRRLAHAGRRLPLHRLRRPGDARRGRPHPGAGRQVHLGRRVLPAAHRAGRLHEAHRGREARSQEDRLPPPHRQRPLPLRPVRRRCCAACSTTRATRTWPSSPSPRPTATPASASRRGELIRTGVARRGGPGHPAEAAAHDPALRGRTPARPTRSTWRASSIMGAIIARARASSNKERMADAQGRRCAGSRRPSSPSR